MIEKLVKEFAKIRTSLAKSKKLILADIDKIDEKYRKLAQEEKKSLTDSLAVLNEQLKYYDKMLDGEQIVEETDEKSEYVEPDPVEEAPEMTIQDTIFPENNEPEAKEEKEEENPVDLDAQEDAEWDQKIQSGEIKKVEPKEEVVENTESANNGWFGEENAESSKKEDEEPVPVVTTDDNGWPIPDDWK